MANPTPQPDGPLWEPEPGFPTEPEFYRRALKYLPTPIVVVDNKGEILYVNQAMLDLGGWSFPRSSNGDILSYVHPEDKEVLAQSFIDVVSSPASRVFGGRQWGEIYFRIRLADGTILPIELIGAGGLTDPAVGGIIYSVRPARTRNLLGRVLDGLSQGASMRHLLDLVGEMVTTPPLSLDAVILQSTSGDGMLVAASTTPTLSDIVRGDTTGMPWHAATAEPLRSDVADLPTQLRTELTDAGYVELWQVAVESPLTATTLRIVAASTVRHVPSDGPKNRLVQARELAAAVLLRSQSDVLLDYAAGHDLLTSLPNRAAFHQRAEMVNPILGRAAIHLDVDGLKHVNDELGAATGDAVLQIVADRLRAVCGEHELIGRVGSDEFAILFDGSHFAESLADRSNALALQILSAVAETIVVAGRPLQITTSIGIALAGSGVSTDHLLTWADAAMRDAKRRGGGQICRYGVAFS